MHISVTFCKQATRPGKIFKVYVPLPTTKSTSTTRHKDLAIAETHLHSLLAKVVSDCLFSQHEHKIIVSDAVPAVECTPAAVSRAEVEVVARPNQATDKGLSLEGVML